ncbi:hypothetical protein WA158_004843, partial [Blastocystis sp. Blastoise]
MVMLSKRRSQHDDVIHNLVKQGTEILDSLEGDDSFKLINTLLDISEGKMTIENERTHLVLRLVAMKESHGDIQGAATTSQEISVEICNTLSPREKAEFLLEQIRLSQITGDYFRVPIYINKMNFNTLSEDNMEDLKEKYLDLCITQHVYDNDIFALYIDYERLLSLPIYELSVNDTDEERECKEKERAKIVSYLCLLIILTKYNADEINILYKLLDTYKKTLEYIPIYNDLLILFKNEELIPSPLPQYQQYIHHSLFTEKKFESRAEEWKELLITRTIQHNIRILSKIFTRGRLSRFAELLSLTEEETQSYITELVEDNIINLKINQLTGIIEFMTDKTNDVLLNEWSSNTKEIMSLIGKTSLL